MKVKIRFFGLYRELAGSGVAEMEVPAGGTLDDLKKDILKRYPRLSPFGENMLIAVGDEYGTAGVRLKEGDEISLLPPVSGGADIEVTQLPISPEAVADKVKRDAYGGLVLFVGRVRDNSDDGKKVLYLEYEAFEEMAVKKLAEVAAEIRARWKPMDVAITHRTGRLEIGDAALVVAVASPHRKEAFDACEYAVDRIKKIVPIWKKEVGEHGGEWVTQ